MGMMVNVNGVLRESSSLVNVNGVLRNCRTLINVNSVLRDVTNAFREISEEDIQSFALIYHVNKNPYHPDFPKLVYNPNIPAKLSLTGETPGECNLENKGVTFEYDRINSKEEGILMYTAHLYAILTDGTPVDVCCFNEPQEVEENLDGFKADPESLDELTEPEVQEMWDKDIVLPDGKDLPNIDEISVEDVQRMFDTGTYDEDLSTPSKENNFIEITSTDVFNLFYYKLHPTDLNGTTEILEIGNKLSNLKIQIQATLIYESNGYYIAGWNSLFSSIQFIDPTRYPEDEKRNFHYMNSYPILPVLDRLDEYNPLAQIGIARSTTNDGFNMNGSYGVLDQTIHWITVNGVKKPFVIEIYN